MNAAFRAGPFADSCVVGYCTVEVRSVSGAGGARAIPARREEPAGPCRVIRLDDYRPAPPQPRQPRSPLRRFLQKLAGRRR